MNIWVFDLTANWNAKGAVAEATHRWHDALAHRGIYLDYTALPPTTIVACEKGEDCIYVCDSLARVYDHWGDSWQWDSGPWDGAYVHLYGSPPADGNLAIAIVVHELGHCLGLNHHEGDTVMTPFPRLSRPSGSDAATCMPGYPLPEPAPPPAPDPPKKKRKRKKKH